ncbi:MAG: BON domain-containing protein [Deltaproteobacteria bacterium]|nr:BON domain-containing protein [Deltaproteobacteria bacterium]
MAKRHRILSFLICIGLIAVFLGCASTRTQEGTGEYIDDSTITTKVKAEILGEPTLKVFQINVETFKGEVQLSGFVDTPEKVKKAGEIARGVKGVKSVKNNLIVKK